MEPVVGMLVFFGSTGFILYTWISSRHKERMAMIEKGVSPADFKSMPLRDYFRPSPLSSLKWGLLALFVGSGIMLANVIDNLYYLDDSLYPASMLICGGLALIIFYSICSRKARAEQ